MAAREITHKGTVLSVADGTASVGILSASSCATCQAAALCTASESSRKVVEVTLLPGQRAVPGQEVEIALRKSLGLKAVLLSYVIPLLIVLIFVVSLSEAGVNELLCGAAALVGAGAWYLVVFLFRKRLEGEYRFYLKTNNHSI
ncbi:MAG: SoxR reducing system RseC family protein [Bacteroidales bacterium]|nr:SoxR reducing system RseC family protein [Bacteroidales bacterium]